MPCPDFEELLLSHWLDLPHAVLCLCVISVEQGWGIHALPQPEMHCTTPYQLWQATKEFLQGLGIPGAQGTFVP